MSKFLASKVRCPGEWCSYFDNASAPSSQEIRHSRYSHQQPSEPCRSSGCSNMFHVAQRDLKQDPWKPPESRDPDVADFYTDRFWKFYTDILSGITPDQILYGLQIRPPQAPNFRFFSISAANGFYRIVSTSYAGFCRRNVKYNTYESPSISPWLLLSFFDFKALTAFTMSGNTSMRLLNNRKSWVDSLKPSPGVWLGMWVSAQRKAVGVWNQAVAWTAPYPERFPGIVCRRFVRKLASQC